MPNPEFEQVKSVEVMRIRQHGREIFIGALPAELLCGPWGRDHIVADRWETSNTEGYQRDATPARVREFAKYVISGRLSPTAVLLNARDVDLKFVPYPGTPDHGRLMIPETATLYKVDGQHRLDGLSEAYNKSEEKLDFSIPVVITRLSRYDEAVQFAVINKTQKGLRTDLTDRVLRKIMDREDPFQRATLPAAIRRDMEWRTAAGRIIELLKDTPVWNGRIQAPNTPKTPENVVTEGALVGSLESMVRKFDISDATAKRAVDTLSSFWSAIAQLCPEATQNAPRDYVLMKTLGVGVMHRILLEAVDLADTYFGGARDENTFRTILSTAGQYMTDDGWKNAAGLGSSKGAENTLYRLIRDAMLAHHTEQPEKRATRIL